MTGRAAAVYLPTQQHHTAKRSDPQDDTRSDYYMAITTKLYDIWYLISLSFHSFRLGFPTRSALPPVPRFEEHLSNISRFDAALAQWERNLPTVLQYTPRAERSGYFDRVSHSQAVLLRLR